MVLAMAGGDGWWPVVLRVVAMAVMRGFVPRVVKSTVLRVVMKMMMMRRRRMMLVTVAIEGDGGGADGGGTGRERPE